MKKKDLHRGAGFLKSLLVCGAFALALLVFPSFKVSAADLTISSKETWNNGSAEYDDLIVNEKGSLTLSNMYVKVNGDVRANGDIILTNGSVLDVNGTYIQNSGSIDVTQNCKVNANGDFRIQTKNASGEYVTGNAMVHSRESSEVNVERNLVIDTSRRYSFMSGTFNVKGNVTLLSKNNSTNMTFADLNLTSNSPQTITLSPNLTLKNLTTVCKTVNVTKYINVTTLANDITFKNPDRKFYISYGTNNYNTKLVTFDGDLYVDTNTSVDTPLNTAGGTINVSGDMHCLSGVVDIRGRLNVTKSLLFEDTNATGDAVPVAAYFYPRQKSEITVGKDFIWNSNKNLSFSQGTMSLSGDYIDKKGVDWLGTVRLLSKGQHVTILNGGYIKNLELAYPRSEYFFNPDECWKNIVEPVPTETPSTTNPAVNNDTTAKDAPVVEKLDSSQKQVKITKLTAAKKKVTVTFKKSKKISGYEVQYDTTKKFNNPTTKNVGAKKTSLTIKKLKSKTTYFVRIRSYKTTAEGKVFSTWSKVKKVKVK
ncbi:MAG: fibronectin type III domain-containing protein [Lachnospiraceae bacterium]|nr:fibronectin type III domain-containing protein [Lachnospiraceae bacterium]